MSVLARFSEGITEARKRIDAAFNRDATFLESQYNVSIALHVAQYGLIAGGMILATLYPHLHTSVLKNADDELKRYSLGHYITAAYTQGRLTEAALVTFVVNLVLGAGFTITTPSLVVPFAGVALAAYRAVLWGLLFPPKQPTSSIPHYITLVIEGEAYILAAVAGCKQSRELLKRLRVSFASESKVEEKRGTRMSSIWSAYTKSIQSALTLYPSITLILAIAAVWEAYEVIHLAR